jgi:lambda repressor-like predicted transcriptional regulator
MSTPSNQLMTRAELAAQLGIHPRTLSNYMKAHGISWSQKLMPASISSKVLEAVLGEPAEKTESKD